MGNFFLVNHKNIAHHCLLDCNPNHDLPVLPRPQSILTFCSCLGFQVQSKTRWVWLLPCQLILKQY